MDQPLQAPAAAPAHVDVPVVGIGASAGGIKALLEFFEHMPQSSGMAFVVVLHLSPKHESSLDKVLQAVTKMPVLQVNEAVQIEKDHIYVISPAKELAMFDGTLVAAARPEGGYRVVATLRLGTAVPQVAGDSMG